MIQANIIDQASGIQTQPTIDRSEATSPPSTSTAVIVGKFKRGIVGRPFVVTNTTYKAILGYDPMNPSYLAVEDAFNLGINKLSVLRTGGAGAADGGEGEGEGEGEGGDSGGGVVPIQCTPTTSYLNDSGKSDPVGNVHARYRVDGGAWIDYVGDTSSYRSSIVGDFFDTIKVDGKRAIETLGNAGDLGDFIDSCTPFRSYRGRDELTGASDAEPFNNYESFILRKRYTTIEFKVTQNNVNDLVYFAFGGDYMATSCAVVGWKGL